MLEIKNYSKSYDDKLVVKNVNLNVEKGEIYGFIGHNGAGKTTTIKSIAGILDFEEGDIFIDGKSIKKDPIGCKSIMAYIPDNPVLYEGLTGIKYLNFIGDIYRVDADKRTRLIKKYSDLFELSTNLGDSISSYS
ncbi:MAG: ATP-binding cassette domain-containing protein, partial [Traorella sp.]